MSKFLLLTILSYKSISAGYLYDLIFKVDTLSCTKEKIRIPSSFACPFIDGYGMVASEGNGLYLYWFKDLEKKGDRALIEEF